MYSSVFSTHWLQLLVQRLAKKRIQEYAEEHIWGPLGMTSSVYVPPEGSDIANRIIRLVRREDGKLVPADGETGRLAMSAPDFGRIMSDLLSPLPKLLKKETADLLFEPQFSEPSPARQDLRHHNEVYAPCAGLPKGLDDLPIKYTVIGMYAEEEFPFPHMPPKTVTWNGMPNVIWAMNKEKGFGMLFATQLVPEDDEKTMDHAMSFFRGAWAKFG